jgi:hypothetical protein
MHRLREITEPPTTIAPNSYKLNCRGTSLNNETTYEQKREILATIFDEIITLERDLFISVVW